MIVPPSPEVATEELRREAWVEQPPDGESSMQMLGLVMLVALLFVIAGVGALVALLA